MHPHLGRGTYQVMIRHKDDPKRSERNAHRRKHGTNEARALKKISKPEDFFDPITDLLYGDHKPRTLNAIGIELIDKSADIIGGSAVEEACWQLVHHRVLRWGVTENSAIVFTTWPEGEPLHQNCEECMSKQLPVLHGPWSYSRAVSCSQKLSWEKVDRLEPTGRPSDISGTDRRALGKAKHVGAEIMLQGMLKKGKWPIPRKVASYVLRQEGYRHLSEFVGTIGVDLERFTEELRFDPGLMLGSELELAIDGKGESCNFWECPEDGWRGITDYAQMGEMLEITDYKNRPATFSKDELRRDMQLSKYAFLTAVLYPQARDVDKASLGIYYFELGIHQQVEVTWGQIDENFARLQAMAKHKEKLLGEEIVPEPGWGKCQYCDYLMKCDGGQAIMDTKKVPADNESAIRMAKMLFVMEEKVSSMRKALNARTAEHGPVLIDNDTGYGHEVCEEKSYDVRAIAKKLKAAGQDPFDVLRVGAAELKKAAGRDKALFESIEEDITVTKKTTFKSYRPRKKEAVKIETKSVKARVKGKGR